VPSLPVADVPLAVEDLDRDQDPVRIHRMTIRPITVTVLDQPMVGEGGQRHVEPGLTYGVRHSADHERTGHIDTSVAGPMP
jgi:hypothetical protein